MLNAPGPVLLGADVHEDVGTCCRSRRLFSVSESFEVGRHWRAVAESTLGLEFVH